jgi:catechol 2,3-dioxygenase-like lactoylglutathione lyase family enzyme
MTQPENPGSGRRESVREPSTDCTITVISGPAQENLDFYAGVLGMRLVKRSVNQDDPGTYHLFYADAEGQPGTDLTFFPWAQMAPPRPDRAGGATGSLSGGRRGSSGRGVARKLFRSASARCRCSTPAWRWRWSGRSCLASAPWAAGRCRAARSAAPRRARVAR